MGAPETLFYCQYIYSYPYPYSINIINDVTMTKVKSSNFLFLIQDNGYVVMQAPKFCCVRKEEKRAMSEGKSNKKRAEKKKIFSLTQ